MDQIVEKVTPHLDDIENEVTLKRAIRRDLNELVNNHYLTMDHYTPSGDMIPPDDEHQHKNTRVLYRLLSAPMSEIRGKASLDRYEIDIVCKPSLVGSFNFTENYDEIPENSHKISFETGNESFIHLWFDSDDLPLNISFSRKPTDMLSDKLRKEINEKMDRRDLYILLSNQSVSRFREEELTMNVTLEFSNNSKTFLCINNFANQNLAYASEWDQASCLGLLNMGNETMATPLFKFEWENITESRVCESTSLLRIGEVFIFCQFQF